MKFKKFDHVVLLGGGDCLADLSVNIDMPVCVITSARHFDEYLPLHNCSFSDFLNNKHVKYLVVDNLLNDSVLEHCNNSMGISFGAAWIFKNDFISKFDGNLLNAHGSLLPRDRGGGGFSWRIMMGDRRGACLLHSIDENIDTGNIVDYRTYNFPKECRTPLDYHKYNCGQYKSFFESFFNKIEAGHDFNVVSQMDYLSTYWPRIKSELNGFINWSWHASHIEKFICAFDDPYCGASTFLNNNLVFLKSCSYNDNENFHPFQYGIIYRIDKNCLFVAANGGSVIVEKVMDSNKNGIFQDMRLGDRFFTPISYIESGLMYRPIYTPKGVK